MAVNEDFLVRIRADLSNFSNGMREAGRQAASTGDRMSNAFKGISSGIKSSLSGATSQIRRFGSGMVSSIGSFAKSAGSSIINAFKNATTRAAQFLKGLGDRALQTAKIAGAALAGLGAATAIGGTKYNAQMEQSLISWETLLKDQGAAAKMMKDLQKMGADTPFEFEGLDAAAKKLQMSGFQGEELFKTLTAVGDAVSAIGGDDEVMGGISTAIFQISSKGKLQAEEAMQLAERGIPVWQILGKQMGKTEAELMDMARSGELVAKDVLPILAEGLTENFGGAMEKQSKTFNGLMNTIKDGVKMLSAALTVPLFEYLKDVLPTVVSGLDTFRNFLEENPQKVEAFWGAIFTVIEAVAKVVGTALGNLYNAVLKPLIAFFEGNRGQIVEFFGAFLEAGKGIASGVGSVLSSLLETVIKPLIAFLMSNKDAFTAFFGTLFDIVKQVVPLVSSLVQTLLNGVLKPLLAAFSGGQGAIFSNFFGTLVGAIQNILPVVGTLINTLLYGVIMPIFSVLNNNRGAFEGFFGSLVSIIQQVIPVVSDIIYGLLNNVITPLIQVFSENKDRITEFFSGFSGVASSAVSVLGEVLGTLLNSVIFPLFSLLNTSKDTIFNVLQAPIEALGNILPALQEGLGSVYWALENLFLSFRSGEGVFNSIIPIIQEVFTTVLPALGEGIGKVVEIIKILLNMVLGGSGEGFTQFFTFAKDIIVAAMGIITNVLNLVIGILTGDMQMAGEAFKGIWDNLSNVVVSVVQNLVPFLLGLIGNLLKGIIIIADGIQKAVLTFLMNLPAILLDGFKKMGEAGAKLGNHIISGIWNGIKAAGANLLKNVASFAGSIVSTFSKVLKIKSPSRVFMEQAGFIVDGLSVGLDKFSGTAENSITGLADGIVGSFNPMLSIGKENFDVAKSLGNLNAQQMNTASTMVNKQQTIVLEGDLAQLVTRVKTDVATEVQNITAGGLV